MPDALTIRPATPNDAQAIARIRVQGWRFAYQGLISQDYLDSLSVAEDTERMRGYLSQFPQNSPLSRSASVQGSSDGKNGRLCSLYATMRCWDSAISARHPIRMTAPKGLFRAGRWSGDSTPST